MTVFEPARLIETVTLPELLEWQASREDSAGDELDRRAAVMIDPAGSDRCRVAAARCREVAARWRARAAQVACQSTTEVPMPEKWEVLSDDADGRLRRMRVPDGWIYLHEFNGNAVRSESSCFVPDRSGAGVAGAAHRG